MGKGKKNKDKLKINTNGEASIGSSDLSTESGTPRVATDGRNVEGWSSTDVSTYNELLLERAKLEKEKNELEHKAERRTTERALLNQSGTNVDSLFAKQPGGDFKYTGINSCCLDMTFDDKCLNGSKPQAVRCKHEICSRSQKLGISWMEMDTIKYYELRIFSEKSERMKNALRKQREVELVRVKKVEDEEYAAKTRKLALLDKADREALKKTSEASARISPGSSASDYQRDAVIEAAKQNDGELSQIRDELEDIRRQVDAGKVTSGDLRSKLDQAQGKMVEAERRNNLFRQMIVEVETVKTRVDAAVATHASLDEDLKKLCATAETAVAQAMTLMKDFFSASGPDQMEETMSRLKTTLEARGPMPKNMRESFKELETMVAESKAKGLKMDFKVDYGGAVTGNSMVDTMTALRIKMKEGSNSSNNSGSELKLDKELVQANQGCIRVEEAAEKEMKKEAQRLVSKPSDTLLKVLLKIKDDAIAKSPIPPLSDIMLESKLQDLMDVHSAGLLLGKAEEGASDQEIAGRITSLVLAKAQNSPEKFLMAYAAVARSFDLASRKKVPEQIKSQLLKVERSMQAWVVKHSLKKQTAVVKKDKPTKPLSSPKEKEKLKAKAEDAAELLAVDKRQLQQDVQDLGRRLYLGKATEKGHSSNSLSSLLKNFLQKHPDQTQSALSIFLQNISTGVIASDADMVIKFPPYRVTNPLAVGDFMKDLHDRGFCARYAWAHITDMLETGRQFDPSKVERDLGVLKMELGPGFQHKYEGKWFRAFTSISNPIFKLHAYVMAHFKNATNTSVETPSFISDEVATICFKILQLTIETVIRKPLVDLTTNAVRAADTIDLVRNLLQPMQVPMSEELEAILADFEQIASNNPTLCFREGCKCPVTAQSKQVPQQPAPLQALPLYPSPEPSNMPKLVITFGRKTAPKGQEPDKITTGELTQLQKFSNMNVARLKDINLHLQAYERAKLDPPIDLILALKAVVSFPTFPDRWVPPAPQNNGQSSSATLQLQDASPETTSPDQEIIPDEQVSTAQVGVSRERGRREQLLIDLRQAAQDDAMYTTGGPSNTAPSTTGGGLTSATLATSVAALITSTETAVPDDLASLPEAMQGTLARLDELTDTGLRIARDIVTRKGWPT